MHRHHTHRAVLLLEIAFDLQLASVEPMQKAFQGGRVLALVGQREGEEFVERIGGVRTETCQQLLAAAPGAEQRCIELEGRDVIRSEEHTSELQSLMRISYAAFCLKN